ncbi:E3 ubiquitin-protein ligase RNF216-like protein 2, partial [Colletotrichum chlorophyti]
EQQAVGGQRPKNPSRSSNRTVAPQNRATNAVHGILTAANTVEEMVGISDQAKSACTAAILGVFPDICPEYLETIAAKFNYSHEHAVDDILSSTENDQTYPKRLQSLKRKREASEDPNDAEKIRRPYERLDRETERSKDYTNMARKVLQQDFPRVRATSVQKVLIENRNHLLPAYLAIEKALREADGDNPPWRLQMKKTCTPIEPQFISGRLEETIASITDPDARRALEELRAVRLVTQAAAHQRMDQALHDAQEAENLEKARQEGTLSECGCCFGEFAQNRMVHCSNEDKDHFFCIECARRNAETVIGISKYELVCMSMDGCAAGFSHSQRQKFLDEHLTAALDRIEYEAVLRMSGIENLETCPFCPYAAEYPPVEHNREFKCDNPECEVISCRLCREETHIPKTCEEAARESGIGARREIEEAMSAALIRKCNKCGTPFIKELGCNKMTCTRAGCGNIQCYVCSKSCDYSHFDDKSRGGKAGNCPLFDKDGVDVRHHNEVEEAELKARQKILESNPKLDEDFLRFQVPWKTNEQPPHPRAPFQHCDPKLNSLDNKLDSHSLSSNKLSNVNLGDLPLDSRIDSRIRSRNLHLDSSHLGYLSNLSSPSSPSSLKLDKINLRDLITDRRNLSRGPIPNPSHGSYSRTCQMSFAWDNFLRPTNHSTWRHKWDSFGSTTLSLEDRRG